MKKSLLFFLSFPLFDNEDDKCNCDSTSTATATKDKNHFVACLCRSHKSLIAGFTPQDTARES